MNAPIKFYSDDYQFVRESYNNKNIIVTGGTGAVGETLLNILHDQTKDFPYKKLIIFCRDSDKFLGVM